MPPRQGRRAWLVDAPGAAPHGVALSSERQPDAWLRRLVAGSFEFPRNARGGTAGTDLALQLESGKGGVGMRAIGLYLLGVPVFVIVILWLFGIV